MPVAARSSASRLSFTFPFAKASLARANNAALSFAFIFGLAFALWQSIEKTRAYNRAVAAEVEAKNEAIASKQIAQFLENMLEGVGPEIAKGRDATI